MTKQYETRLSTSAFRVTGGHDGSVTLSGLASATGVEYHVGYDIRNGKYVQDFMERIEPGAFKETLADEADVTLLINHRGLPLARTSSGTLKLWESERGLEVEADLVTDDPDVARLVYKMQRGDMDKMSIGFWVLSDEWSDDYGDRTITKISLNRGDVSVVTHPANAATSAKVRTLDIPPVRTLEAAKTVAEADLEAANKVALESTKVPEGGYNKKHWQTLNNLR